MDIRGLIITINLIACYLPAIAGVFCYRHLNRPAKILTFYFIVVTIIENASFYLIGKGQNSIRLYHFFDPIEYFCIVFAFSYWMGNQTLNRVMRYSIIAFLALSLANSLRMEDINHYSYAALSIAYLVYVFVSSYAIYQLIIADRGAITLDPIFWLAASLLIMSANNEFWYAFNGYLENMEIRKIFYLLHLVFNILSYLMTAVGFLLFKFPVSRKAQTELSIFWK